MNPLFYTTLPNTGEAVKDYGVYGIVIIILVICFLLWRKKKDDKKEDSQDYFLDCLLFFYRLSNAAIRSFTLSYCS